MEPGSEYIRYDGQKYIWHWWETKEYHHLFSVIQDYNDMNPDSYKETPKYQLIKAISDTKVKCNRLGWYWDITKQNLEDIQEALNAFRNNENKNKNINTNNYKNRQQNREYEIDILKIMNDMDYDLSNYIRDHNDNNRQIYQSDDQIDNEKYTDNNNNSCDYTYDNIGFNNNENAKFVPYWMNDDKYQDLVQAIKKYSNIVPCNIDDKYEKEFAKVLQQEKVNYNNSGWWWKINANNFKDIKEAYDKLPNKKVDNNTNNHQYNKKRKQYANYEAHGFYNGNQIIDHYNLDHRISKQYKNHAISRRRAEEYIMNSKNINGINNYIWN